MSIDQSSQKQEAAGGLIGACNDSHCAAPLRPSLAAARSTSSSGDGNRLAAASSGERQLAKIA